MAITFNSLGKMGRLGNQLFQIASTIGIATHNNHKYCFPEWVHQKNIENILPSYKLGTESTVHEKQFHFEMPILPLTNINYDLYGFFQSEKYWEHCKELIHKTFDFKLELKRRINYIWHDAILQNPIAVHVRRGDYLNLSEYHTNLTLEYYNNSIKEFGNELYIIFSDDIIWCKENFKGENFYIATGNECEDLYLMSQCKGHIIANSSFSWWGAYLAKSEKVIAPKKWFGEKLKHDTKDLYLQHWTLR